MATLLGGDLHQGDDLHPADLQPVAPRKMAGFALNYAFTQNANEVRRFLNLTCDLMIRYHGDRRFGDLVGAHNTLARLLLEYRFNADVRTYHYVDHVRRAAAFFQPVLEAEASER